MMSLHYQSIGQGPAIIIIHGLFGSADNWRTIARQLAGSYRVISIDCRNHGRSFHHPQQDYAVMAKDIADLLDRLALSSVSLIGHSMGGKVAMQFAQDYPQRLDKLIVVDMAPRAYQDEHSLTFKSLMALNLPALDSRQAVDDALAKTIDDPLVRQFLLLNLLKSASGFQWRMQLEHVYCNYPNLLKSVLPTSPVPHAGTFIKGENSDYLTDEDWQQISPLFPAMQLEIIHNAGHWVHADQADQFLETVKKSLQDD